MRVLRFVPISIFDNYDLGANAPDLVVRTVPVPILTRPAWVLVRCVGSCRLWNAYIKAFAHAILLHFDNSYRTIQEAVFS